MGASSLSALERLPVELVQVIAWHAQNPLLFLVSKTITSKLPTLADYEFDLALSLWCDRHQAVDVDGQIVPVGWGVFGDTAGVGGNQANGAEATGFRSKRFPWRTPIARGLDWKPDTMQRLEIQKSVLELPWLTERKFRSIAKQLLNIWLAYRWSDEDYAPGEKEQFQKAVDDEQHSDFLLIPRNDVLPSVKFSESHTQRTGEISFELWAGCQVCVRLDGPHASQFQRDSLQHSLMDTLYTPLRLLNSSASTVGATEDNLFSLLRHSRALQLPGPRKPKISPVAASPSSSSSPPLLSDYHPRVVVTATTVVTTGSIEFSRPAALTALRGAIDRDDKIAFIRLFGLFISQLSLRDIQLLEPAVTDELIVKLPYGCGTRISWAFKPPWSIDRLSAAEFACDKNRAAWQQVKRLFDILAKSKHLDRCVGL